MLDNTSNQPCKFRTKSWVERNDESRGIYNTNSQIKIKTTMLKSSSCASSDAYVIVKWNVTVNNRAADGTSANNTNKKVLFRNYAAFTNYISEIHNTQVNNANDIDILMPANV